MHVLTQKQELNVPVKVRTDFMSFASANGMTLCATHFEKLSTAFGVTYRMSYNAYGSLENLWQYLLTRSARHSY